MFAFTIFRSTDAEAILDRYETVEVRSYEPARGFVEILDSAGAVRHVAPGRLRSIVNGSMAEAIIERAERRHRVFLNGLTG